MPPATDPAKAALILDHVLGDLSVPAAVANALLAKLQPSVLTPRLRRAVLLRRLAEDPVSASSLKTIQLLAKLPSASASPSSIAAAHIAVAVFLAVTAPNFDATARELFRRPDGRVRQAVDGEGLALLVSGDGIAMANQLEAAIGDPGFQAMLRVLWGNRANAEERVRELLAAEWASIGPSKLEAAAERIVGDGAVETWRAADEATRAKLRILAGEEKTREILGKLGEPTSSSNPISTPDLEEMIDALKIRISAFNSVVVDPLPAAKAVADEVLAARKDKGVSLNDEQVRGQPTTRGAAGPSTLNDKGKGPSRGKPYNIMDRNPTAQTFQWEESPEPSLRRPHLPSLRRVPPSPLAPPKNKRKQRKNWSVLEEETLRKAVQEHGQGNWKDILNSNRDVFIDRTQVDLKDKWRNMTKP